MSDDELVLALRDLEAADERDLVRNPLKLIRHPRLGIIPLSPWPKQWEFIRRYRAVQKVMGWDGPNRAGKSAAASMVILQDLTGWPIEGWPELPVDLSHTPLGPPRHWGCITISKEKSRDGQQKFLAERIPTSILDCKPWTEKTGFGSQAPTLVLTNGSTVNFLSDLQRHQSLEAFAWHGAWIDEAIDDWAYKRIIARLVDTGGKLIITAVAEKAWIYRVLRLRLMTLESDEPVPQAVVDTVGDSTMRDNPTLTEQEIANAVRLWGGAGSREARMRVEGQYVHLEGLVFSEDYDDLGCIEPTEPPPASWTRYEWYDPGYHNPFAVLFAATDPGGTVHIYDEIYVREHVVPQVAGLVMDKRRQYDYREPMRAKIDAAADQARDWGRAKVSIRQELAAHGIYPTPADNSPGSLDAGLQLIRKYLRAGRLKIQAHCRWTRFEFMNHRYRDPDESTGEFLGDKERPVDAHNHAISCLRYGLADGPSWVPPAEASPPPGSPLADLARIRREKAARRQRPWR